MLKTFPIDFIRQAFEQELLQEHLNNENFFGGKDQVNIFSFYEQLKSQDEVDRFVETYRDLTEQQNRSGLILNGVLVAPENPTITNLYSSLIIPMSFTCSMRCLIGNRDQAIWTINNLINKLKGRKVDIAQLDCVDENGNHYAQPFMVGTIGSEYGKPNLKNKDYIGLISSNSVVDDKLLTYFNITELSQNDAKYFYCENDNKLKVVEAYKGSTFNIYETTVLNVSTIEIGNHDYLVSITAKLKGNPLFGTQLKILYNDNNAEVEVLLDDDSTRTIDCYVEIVKYESVDNYPEITVLLTPKNRFNYDDVVNVESVSVDLYYKEYRIIEDDGEISEIIFPPEHDSFEKYKVSFSFDAIRCDEPRNLNAEEYCELSFGGSATLVNKGVKLGNDLLKISFRKLGIPAENYIDITQYTNNPTYWLEPLEMPSGSNANSEINQLMSNKFITNNHNDALALTLQYTFIIDLDNPLLKQWFRYARYGAQATSTNNYQDGVTPNMIYEIKEYWSSWGEYEIETYKGKATENMDIDNTESDTLTISATFQLQGENN